MIEKYSPNAKACKLTIGYKEGELKYHHAYFGVPKESPYQEKIAQTVCISFRSYIQVGYLCRPI